MSRHYSRPYLLIEFEEGKPFALRGIHVKTYQIKELMEKLMLTILHFPKVRLLWSPSPLDTALMFSALKENSDDPLIEDALAHEAGSRKRLMLNYRRHAPLDRKYFLASRESEIETSVFLQTTLKAP